MLFREEDEDLEILPFEDRTEAGRILAGRLSAYAGRSDVVVFGVPRGGALVASAVASALHIPWDVFVVTQLGTPWQPELAMGAVAAGGVQVLDLSLVKTLGLSDVEIKDATAKGRRELEARESLYRGGRLLLELKAKTVILVDDGIATGCSVLAAIAAVRRRSAPRVVVAVPVAPASGCSGVRMEADDVISVAEPEMFLAVSEWYRNFPQVSDEEVRLLLGGVDRSVPRVA
jgi:putative phosphoribosyl transferase